MARNNEISDVLIDVVKAAAIAIIGFIVIKGILDVMH